MPRIPRMLPADRIWAHLDRFECECPACGTLIGTARLPKGIESTTRRKSRAIERPRSQRVWDLTWNPVTQRLRCPSCRTAYTAGLVLYSLKPGARRILEAPPDTVAGPRERAALRQKAGGFRLHQARSQNDPVNLVVTEGCSCPAGRIALDCPVHGVFPE
jgi:hypothetical protein